MKGVSVNPEAERVVIGKILNDDRLWYDIADRLAPEDFAFEDNAKIWKAMRSLIAAGQPITRPAVIAHIGDCKPWDEVHVADYLIGVAAEAAKPGYAKLPVWHFGEIVLHASGCRRLVKAGDEIKLLAQTATAETPLVELRGKAAQLVAEGDADTPADAKRIGDLITNVISAAGEAHKHGAPVGTRTGFKPLDSLVGPLLPGRLVVIGGETSSGKTALAVQAAWLVAHQGIPVHITELEMEGSEIATRVLARAAMIASDRIADGDVNDLDLERMMAAGEGLLELPIWIDSHPRQSVPTIQAKLARAKAQHGVKLGIIDHLQYVLPDNRRGEEREQIRQVVDDIKAMAKRLQMPIILVSHVSRQTDFSSMNTAADVKRPTLSNLYGSSAIEKAADSVVFVHRPGWFLERATPAPKFKAQWQDDMLRWKGMAELVLPKRRAGKGFGVCECLFDEATTWFEDMEEIGL